MGFNEKQVAGFYDARGWLSKTEPRAVIQSPCPEEKMETMATFINHYSFLLLFALAGIGLAVLLLRDGMEGRDLVALGALGLGFAFAFSTFSPGESTIAEVEEAEVALREGRPVLLEIQSPYCLACAAAKPTVDRIEAEHPRLRIIRANIQESVGTQLAERYRTRVTPTFIFFDTAGQEVLRTYGAIDPHQIERLLEN